ncbi:SspB family protein [Salinarimonas sp.]|uniref:SspB family protein n=1 Tax=Salinarimonas sp. TaxID=2766526 RepID=UPI0039190C9D
MTQDLIRYDLLVQDALKGVVRKVLGDAARDGLKGEHHFYVSFQTQFPGVRLSTRMREKYPDTMTIVLQHQFWDLAVSENGFEVGLSFGGVPERLLVPFDALTGFFDPSVQFGLKFEIREPAEIAPRAPEAAPPAIVAPPVAAPRVRGAGSEPAEAEPRRAPATTPRIPAAKQAGADAERPAAAEPAEGGEPGASPAPASASGKGAKGSAGKVSKAEGGASEAAEDRPVGAEVVSLDAFRKKP